MQRIKKMCLTSVLCLTTLAGIVAIRKTNNNILKAAIPDGYTLDSSYDEVSLADLTLAGRANQTMVNLNGDTDVAYNKQDADGSLVYKFKYNVVDDTKSDAIAYRIHFDVSDDKWDSTNSLWIRGDNVFLWKPEISNWSGSGALTKGMHEIEFGRIALYQEGVPSGQYYVYYKLDGVEKDTTVATYDASKMGNTMFFNINAKNNNEIYDANLSYEAPQYVSISDLAYNGTYSKTVKNESKSYSYDTTNATANKSVVFKSYIDYAEDQNSQIYIYGAADANWNSAGYAWLQKDKVFLGTTKADGSKDGNFQCDYRDGFVLENGQRYAIEYGRLAIMDGDEFTGRYHVYFKINDKIVGAIDQAIESAVSAAGNIHLTGDGGFDYVDVYSYEAPQYISVSDLHPGGGNSSNILTNDTSKPPCTYTPTAQYGSVVFNANIDYKAAQDSQLHLQGPSSDNWANEGYIWFQKDKVYFGINDATGTFSSNKQFDYGYTLEEGSKHNIEYGRLAIMDGTRFTGKYHVYFAIDGNEIASVDQVIKSDVAEGGRLYFTGSGGFDFVDSYSYETPKEISINDLSLGGTPVGDKIDISSATSYAYDNSDHADNYSLVFKYKYTVNELNQNQFHLTDVDNQWNTASSYILANGGTKVHLGKSTLDNNNVGWTDVAYPFVQGQTYDVEYGRLAKMINGMPTGSYYTYVKINDSLISDYTGQIADSIVQGNNVFITSDGKNSVKDINSGKPVKDSTYDEVSVSDLTLAGLANQTMLNVNTNTDVTYNKQDEDGSLVYKFKYNVVDDTNSDSIAYRIHFDVSDDKWDTTNSLWIRGDSVYLWNPEIENWSACGALTKGMHDIEFGRLALFVDGQATNQYYVYYKLDGQEVKNVVGTYDPAKMGNTMFFNISSANHNEIYDANLSYENPQVLSISDLHPNGATPVKTITNSQTAYTYTPTATNGSISLFATIDYKAAQDSQIHLINRDSDNWNNDATIWLKNDKVHFAVNDDTGAFTKFNEVVYPEALVAGQKYNFEFGKLAIMDGDTFTGRYHLYVKLDGKMIYGLDEKLSEAVAAGGKIFFTGSGGFDFVDSYSYETPKEISISDLSFGGTPVGDKIDIASATNYTYDNSDHTDNYSLVFKYKYTVNELNQNQFHLSDVDNQWNTASSYILANGGTKVHLGKSALDNNNAGWTDVAYPFVQGQTYDVEFGRLAKLFAGKFTGDYYTYIKINGEIVSDYTAQIAKSVLQGNCVFITSDGKNTVYDNEYVFETKYETPDYISVSDLRKGGSGFGDVIDLDSHQTFEYTASASHKSVVYNFIYDCVDPSSVDCQLHFTNGWTADGQGGMVWLRNDNIFISKMVEGYASGNSPFTAAGLYYVEVGKLYIESGLNAGKYYVYVNVDGMLVAEYTVDSMPEKANLFTTGTNGDLLYDIHYMPMDLASSLYLYKWDVNRSGIQFSASLRKDLADFENVSEVGFIISPANDLENSIKVTGKLVEDGNNYVVKAAYASLDVANITSNYVARAYVVIPNGEDNVVVYSDAITSSLYKELNDLSGISESYLAALNALKNSVLNVTLDDDDCSVAGATITGDFSSSSIILTGANDSYISFILNGKVLVNNSEIMVGYTPYKVTLSENSIILAKQAKKMIYGGSEHFYEINPGHDENMTAANLAPMTSELGLKSVRIDLSLPDLFTVTADNELKIKYDYLNRFQTILDELKENGEVTDFLAVLWPVVPNGFATWEGKPWSTHTAPDPVTQPEIYLQWLQLNRKAANLAAKLIPDVKYFETWNEPEIMGEENGPLARPDGTNYTLAEKALILTDLMYYYNAGIKDADPNNILTSPSVCCIQGTDSNFDAPSVDFLAALYEAISDDKPVAGYTSVDDDANNYFQVINVHPYLTGGLTLANWTDFMNELHTIAATYDDGGTQIWATEFGFPQNRYDSAVEDIIAVLDLANDIDCVTRLYFYKVHDYTDKIDNDRWGLYDYDGNIKATGTAVKEYINAENA